MTTDPTTSDSETSAVDALVAQLTTAEKVALVAGEDLWHRPGIPRLGIPAMRVTDGPNGARGTSFNGDVRGVCVPCGTALAATWNTALVREIGVLLGEETRRRGAAVLLAPTVNLHRSPIAGRNFECYSEDPELTARMAVAYIQGVQSTGVAATVKHFVANDSEVERLTVSSDVGERALRELYLRPFEAAVREGEVWAVMTAYNRLNGTYCSEHPWLLEDVLRGEWNFDGLVMSDWWGLHSTAPGLSAGLDLEMPGPPNYRGEALEAALDVGQVDEGVLDVAVRVLELSARTGTAAEQPGPETTLDLPADRALVRRAAAEATVLLENRGLIPLDTTSIATVAVVGRPAMDPAVQGGGSAHVTPLYKPSLVSTLRSRLAGAGVAVGYEPGVAVRSGMPPLDMSMVRSADGTFGGFDAEIRSGRTDGGPVALRETVRRPVVRWWGRYRGAVEAGQWNATLSATLVFPTSGSWTVSLQVRADAHLRLGDVVGERTQLADGRIRVASTVDVEAGDELDLSISVTPEVDADVVDLDVRCRPPEDLGAFDRAVASTASADVAVVVVGLDETWESEGFDRVDMALPGRQDELVRAVAAVNERTIVVVNAGSPVEMDWAGEVGAVLYAWYPGQEAGDAWADVILGDEPPGGRLPTTFPLRFEDSPAALDFPERGHLVYGEGLFIGYRWYDARGIPVRYPFGFGLSTTNATWGRASIETFASTVEGPYDEVIARVTVPLSNVGPRAGHEVVQVYLADPESTAPRPPKELAGFAKVRLEAGASAVARIDLPRRAFRFWDPNSAGWVIEPGRFEILVARNALTIESSLSIDLG